MKEMPMNAKLICFLLGMSLLIVDLMGESRLMVSSTSTKPAEPAVYDLQVAFDSPVSNSSRIEILFPAGYNVSGVSLASSEKLGGVLPVSLRSDTLVIELRGITATLAPRESFDIKLAPLLNPINAPSNGHVIVMLKEGKQEIERAESLSAAEENKSNQQ